MCDRAVITFHGGDWYADGFGDWLSCPGLAFKICSVLVGIFSMAVFFCSILPSHWEGWKWNCPAPSLRLLFSSSLVLSQLIELGMNLLCLPMEKHSLLEAAILKWGERKGVKHIYYTSNDSYGNSLDASGSVENLVHRSEGSKAAINLVTRISKMIIILERTVLRKWIRFKFPFVALDCWLLNLQTECPICISPYLYVICVWIQERHCSYCRESQSLRGGISHFLLLQSNNI